MCNITSTFAILLSCLWTVTSLELQTIGIYSICGDNYTQNEFTNFAETIDMFVSKVFDNSGKDMVSTLFHEINILSVYKSYDVCYDIEKMVTLVTDLLLDSAFYAINKTDVVKYSHIWDWERPGTIVFKAERSTMIYRIVAHIPHDLLKILLDLMSNEVTIITKHSTLIPTTSLMMQGSNFYNMEDSFSDIVKYLDSRRWADLLVVHLKTGDIFTPHFNLMLETLSQMKGTCIKALTIENKYESRKLLQYIESEYQRSNFTRYFTLIIIGNERYIEFNMSAGYLQHVFLVTLYFSSFHAYSYVGLEKIALSCDNLRDSVERQTSLFLDTINFKFFKNNSIIQNNRATFLALGMSQKPNLKYYILNTSVHEQKWSAFLSRAVENPSRGIFLDFIRADVEIPCFQPACPPGYEKVFGRIPINITFWEMEIGYYCRLCKSNYIKSSYGDTSCQTCPGYFISNQERTVCVDPMISVYHKPSEISIIIVLLICSIGTLLCLTTIGIFIKFRETSICKTSDLRMSIVQLIAILLFHVSILISFFTFPTRETCIARTLSIVILYNLNVSIMFTKSNKLIRAFTSMVRATQSEVLKTTLLQYFITLLNIVSALLLVAVLWSNKGIPGVITNIYIKDSKKFLYCNNTSDNTAICCFMILLQLACFLQAFRCRKLPGHINEAMAIVYASLISTVSLCVMFPIQYFQKKKEDGEVVVALVLSGNNMVLFLFMYGKKIFTILFRPEKNTKAYFRRKQMEMIENKTTKLESFFTTRASSSI